MEIFRQTNNDSVLHIFFITDVAVMAFYVCMGEIFSVHICTVIELQKITHLAIYLIYLC